MYYYVTTFSHQKAPNVTSTFVARNVTEPDVFKANYPTIFKNISGHSVIEVKELTAKEFYEIGERSWFECMRGLERDYAKYKRDRTLKFLLTVLESLFCVEGKESYYGKV